MHHAHLAEQVHQGNAAAAQASAQLSAAGYGDAGALAMINRTLDQQAFTVSVTDLFWMSSVLFLALIALVWLTRPRRGGGAMGDAGGAH